MKTFAGIVVVGAFFVASCVMDQPALRAQEQAAVSAEKSPQLPPGLDTSFMDTTTDPCVNFAQYACGNFSKVYPTPADMPGYGPFYIMYEHTEYTLHSLLKKVEADDSARTPNEQKTGDYYATCMNKDAIQEAGLKPLLAELDRIAALKSKSELTTLLAHYQMINVNGVLQLRRAAGFEGRAEADCLSGPGRAGIAGARLLPADRSGDEKTRQQYVQHVTNMLKLLGETDDAAASDARRSWLLETALAKASMDITSQRDPNECVSSRCGGAVDRADAGDCVAEIF
jgi:putative endopeptidase